MAGFEPASSPAPKAGGVTGLPNIPYSFFSAESRILEIHPFYRTTHLAGGDNTLIVLLSIL